jgi:hypothetical protein
LYENYRFAGLPYGDTHDGFMRWQNEQLAMLMQRQEEEEKKGSKHE